MSVAWTDFKMKQQYFDIKTNTCLSKLKFIIIYFIVIIVCDEGLILLKVELKSIKLNFLVWFEKSKLESEELYWNQVW